MQVDTRPITPVELFGIPVHPVTLEEAGLRLGDAIARREPTTVISLNGALLMRALRDAEVREAVRSAALIIPDGVGVVLASRILGLPIRRRVAGVDLVLAMCEGAAARGDRLFLLGAARGVAEAAAARLRERYPGLMIVGTADGFFSPEDEPALLARIREAHPEILLVAFGAPRQERWLHARAPALGVPVMMGVGGALDVLAGRVRRAPRWLQAAGLEWLYRMVREPWRWSVVRTIPPLFALAMRERWRRRGGRGSEVKKGGERVRI